MEFCSTLYEIQWKEGRYLLHEHPESASSWHEKCIKRLLAHQGVVRVVGDQCQYGLKSHDGQREGPARKSSGFMTNSPCIAKRLSKRCLNGSGMKVHDHVILINGRAKAAQVYPPEVCRAICQGLIEQIEADRMGQFFIAEINLDGTGKGNQMMKEAESIKEKYKIVEEDYDQQLETAWDDVSGSELDPQSVKKARAEEIEYVNKMKLYTKVLIAECLKTIGKRPIAVRWIDINKGDKINPNYRSRLVAKEINTYKRDDLFAGTPPLEALKILLSMTASSNNGEIVMVNDVSRAFFHAKARRDVFVQIAEEDKQPGDETMCGKLNFSMYGTRDAAQNWATEYADMLVSIGFAQGSASPCVFYHEERQIRTFVHGDDYVSSALPKQLEWLKGELERKYQIKTQWLGSGKQYQQEVKILNRIVGWDDARGLVFEADPRHAEIIIEQMKLKEAKVVSTLGTKDEGRTSSDCDELFDENQASQYRAITARCNYIVPDRADLAYSVKELARHMSKPTRGDWVRLKRVARYLLGRPRMQQIYPWQNSQNILKVYTDADWAGCRETRKSTTGGCAMLGRHALKGWSKTQALIAISSGESELYAALKASAEALGLISLLQDLGYRVKGEVWGDASAALCIINRRGVGKTRHIEIGLLWIQQTAADQRLKYLKVLGRENPADLYTKFLDNATSDGHVKRFEYSYIEGRSSEAPT